MRPPTAYSVPLMAATPSSSRAVGIDAFVDVPLTGAGGASAGLNTQAAAFVDALPTVVRRRLVALNAPAPVASGGPSLGLSWVQVGVPPRPFALPSTHSSAYVPPPEPPPFCPPNTIIRLWAPSPLEAGADA